MKTSRPIGRPIASPNHDTRALLLDAATELFAETGVAATTFATIARRAGLTPAMAHYHFDHRDQLLDAVVDERFIPLLRRVWDPVEPGLPPSELLAGFVHRLIEQTKRFPWVPSTWMREILNERGLLRSRVIRRLPFEKIRVLGGAIAAGQRSGTVNRNLDPLLVVFSALGLVMLHMATIRIWADIFERRALSPRAMERHITSLILHGTSLLASPQPHPSSGSKRNLRSKP